MLKIGKYELLDWTCTTNKDSYQRYILINEKIKYLTIYYSKPVDVLSMISQVEINQTNKNELWSIKFKDRLAFVQNMFDSQLDRVFQINEIESAKSYVDNFLFKSLNRINQLVSFL